MQVVTAVTHLRSDLQGLHRDHGDLHRDHSKIIDELRQNNILLERRVDEQQRMLNILLSRTGVPQPAGNTQTDNPVPAAPPSDPIAAAPPPRARSVHDALMRTSQSTPNAFKISGVHGWTFYLDYMAAGGALRVESSIDGFSKSDATRVNLLLDWFNGMATPAEHAMLFSPASAQVDGGLLKTTASELSDLIVYWLVETFQSAELGRVPTTLLNKDGKPIKFLVSALSTRFDELKKMKTANGAPVITRNCHESFQAWRQKRAGKRSRQEEQE